MNGIAENFSWTDRNKKSHYNPRLTKLFFVTRLTKRGVATTPSLDFPNQTPYEIDFGINR